MRTVPRRKLQNGFLLCALSLTMAVAIEPCAFAYPGNSPKEQNPPKPHEARLLPLTVDPQINLVLQRLRNAEKTLSFIGEQVTVLYRPNGQGVTASTRTVYRDGDLYFRSDYHTPASINGETTVSRPEGSWQYIPAKHILKSGPPKRGRIMTGIGVMSKAIRAGEAEITLVGMDTVDGRSTTVLLISGTGRTPTGALKMWVDQESGLQMRTEVYNSSGQMQSVSYFTQITLNPAFASGTFDIPAVPPGTTQEAESQDKPVNHIPTDAEAGFHVLQPSGLPGGYNFQSASMFHIGQRRAVALRYNNGAAILSVFQSPLEHDQMARPETVRTPRTGTVVMTANGMEFAAIGTVTSDQLIAVLRSMH